MTLKFFEIRHRRTTSAFLGGLAREYGGIKKEHLRKDALKYYRRKK
jgi:hypothetical protein